MVTRFFRTNDKYATVATTRVVVINASSAVRIVMNTGNSGISICNVGSATLVWGDSSILSSSAGLLFYSMEYKFMNVNDDFDFYLRTDGGNGEVAITEFRS